MDAQVADLLNANSVNESNSISPRINPPQSNNIFWSSYRQDWIKNGVTYEVQHLTAQSTSSPSSLWGTTVAVLQNSNSFVAASENLMFTVMKTAGGTISDGVGIAISFYDAVKSFISDANFTKTTVVNNVKITYQTNQYQSIDFMYVKVKSNSDTTQKLTFVTNEVSGDTAALIPTFTYGPNGATSGSSSIPVTKQFSYKAPKHRDGSQAVASFLDPVYQPGQSFLNELQVTGIKGNIIHYIPMTVKTEPGALN
ncbi:hypothetical protein [Paenibacillus chibensis]|uniref:hypothetical protein n=1 Tax=Paenibacillus chibensis TaxID=59846 RepID=UPI000FD9237F|nr:hypothetical protein [Paenibacillus chibensis]MEC0371820.1 hypothetical protein [Paenibacillus chibensis]